MSGEILLDLLEHGTCKTITVLVVDGQLGALHKLGFPLPALASMQEGGALLSEASWNVRKSLAGLSVSILAHQPGWCCKCG